MVILLTAVGEAEMEWALKMLSNGDPRLSNMHLFSSFYNICSIFAVSFGKMVHSRAVIQDSLKNY